MGSSSPNRGENKQIFETTTQRWFLDPRDWVLWSELGLGASRPIDRVGFDGLNIPSPGHRIGCRGLSLKSEDIQTDGSEKGGIFYLPFLLKTFKINVEKIFHTLSVWNLQKNPYDDCIFYLRTFSLFCGKCRKIYQSHGSSGIGKNAMFSWCCWFRLSPCPYNKCVLAKFLLNQLTNSGKTEIDPIYDELPETPQ